MSEATAYPGYATPTFGFREGCWLVKAFPWHLVVGRVYDHGAVGWTSIDGRGYTVGLYPTQQAAGEALVKHAGYEVLR